jgi:hypothetical protein
VEDAAGGVSVQQIFREGNEEDFRNAEVIFSHGLLSTRPVATSLIISACFFLFSLDISWVILGECSYTINILISCAVGGTHAAFVHGAFGGCDWGRSSCETAKLVRFRLQPLLLTRGGPLLPLML